MRKPDDDAWNAFTASLENAGGQFALDEAGGGQAGAIEALMAVVRLLDASGSPSDRWTPFLRTAMALSDLKSGKKISPMLVPAPGARRGPKEVSDADKAQRAFVAALLEKVMQRRDFPSLEGAARWVARKARRLPSLANGSAAEPWQAVKDWREAARAGRVTTDVDCAVFHAALAALAQQPDIGRDAIANCLLSSAAQFGAPAP